MPSAMRQVTSGPNSPMICVPTIEQATPDKKARKHDLAGVTRAVDAVHHVGHEKRQRIGEGTPGQPWPNRNCTRIFEATTMAAMATMPGSIRVIRFFRFDKVAETWPRDMRDAAI